MDYQKLTSIENLFQAWEEFKKGKRKRRDVQEFERNLEYNLFSLHEDLMKKTYKHGGYNSFYVQDPKLRHIHKAPVRDRIVHRLFYKYLYDLFDKCFIFDSYSCRLNKGTHKAVKRLEKFCRKVSRNYSQDCWALKLDVKKFFASVDQEILKALLREKISDGDILWLMNQVIDSFCSEYGESEGIPLGNLTSQIFANIYLNGLDQFVKHELRIKFYLRYADDFLILSKDRKLLKNFLELIECFVEQNLKLELHPNKITLRKLDWGIDFLGYVVLPYYILPRTKTKKRMLKKLRFKVNESNFNQSLNSYLGYLSHSKSYKLTKRLKNEMMIFCPFSSL